MTKDQFKLGVAQGVYERFQPTDGPAVFLKTDTGGNLTSEAKYLYQYFTTRTENAQLLLDVFAMWALLV